MLLLLLLCYSHLKVLCVWQKQQMITLEPIITLILITVSESWYLNKASFWGTIKSAGKKTSNLYHLAPTPYQQIKTIFIHKQLSYRS